MMTDPIADMFTIIRNANAIHRPEVTIPHSKIKERIVEKLKKEGFIKDYSVVEQSPRNVLNVQLKYGPDGEQVIREIQRVSKPGRRIYKAKKTLKPVLNGLGIALLSTSKGIMTDYECKKQNLGGELLGVVW